MKRGFRRRKTLRETLLESQRGLNMWAALTGKPALQLDIPEKRTRKDSAVDIDAVHRKQPVPLEKEVLRSIGELLAVHPAVLFALRMNSGAASYEAASGKFAPVWFHVWVRSPQRCRMSDFFGATVDHRMLALEVKRPGWTKPTDERERQQAAFLETIRGAGGIGAFVTSSDEVARLLA
jgi:hypothetical protein